MHRRSMGISRNIWADASMEGLYVGENSEIPNVNGMRTDVVEALKRLRFRYCAGRGDVLRTSITGKTESDRKRTGRK